MHGLRILLGVREADLYTQLSVAGLDPNRKRREDDALVVELAGPGVVLQTCRQSEKRVQATGYVKIS